jgi:hypothetical protein
MRAMGGAGPSSPAGFRFFTYGAYIWGPFSGPQA